MKVTYRGDVPELIALLSDMEHHITEDWSTCANGEGIVKAVTERLPDEQMAKRVNIIPGGISGMCQNTLVVVIGSRDSDVKLENRILEAALHISGRCKGITKHVIFWAARWNSETWAKHKGSFRSAMTVLKPFMADVTLLVS